MRDVIDATVRELARVGYAALRMEDVAAVAGVNKTTVYRRWATKSDLVTAALTARALPDFEMPDTGALRTDLLALLRPFVARVSKPEGRALARMMLMEMDHPDVAALSRGFREKRLTLWVDIVHRAVKRGELPAGSEPRLLVDILMGTVMTRVRCNEKVDDDYLHAVIELVVLGAQHGGAIPR
ncbi:Transcriptional regulator, TetR family protein [Minicystis rosea]|nr:Transcriptional regulator, TetR family protein [Minicystis rosea]